MRVFGLILALVMTGSIAVANARGPALGSASPQHGALHVTKECSVFTGLADSFCTITSSNIPAITAGSRVVYLQAAGATSLDSDVVLVVGPGNYALGHVMLDLATGTGEITFTGGAGRFTGFYARADVSQLGGPNVAWDGKYRFGSQHRETSGRAADVHVNSSGRTKGLPVGTRHPRNGRSPR